MNVMFNYDSAVSFVVKMINVMLLLNGLNGMKFNVVFHL